MNNAPPGRHGYSNYHILKGAKSKRSFFISGTTIVLILAIGFVLGVWCGVELVKSCIDIGWTNETTTEVQSRR